MRFLWVEDFNEDQGDREFLEARWRNYFELGNVIILEDLKSALEYLDNREHYENFDGVLLDIRFPAGGNDDGLYEEYFSHIVTREKFDQYLEDGTGILLYLALAFRYSYNQERIAFISGNVDEGSDMKPLKAMRNLLIKSRYERLDENDKEEYRAQEISLIEHYIEKRGHSVPRLEDDTIDWEKVNPLITWEALSDNNAEDILEQLETVGETLRAGAGSAFGSLKYSCLRSQFQEFGLILPLAFDKPFLEKDLKNWEFCRWRKSIETPYYILRSNVTEMCRILRDHLNLEMVRPFWSHIRLRKDDSQAESWKEDMWELLKRIPDMLPGMASFTKEKTMEGQLESVAREILRFIDDMPGSDKQNETREFFACRLVMKLSRNWFSHQGIRGLTPGDCGFLILIALRGYFDLSVLNQDQLEAYQAYEEEVLALLGSAGQPPENLEQLLADSFHRLLRINQESLLGVPVGKNGKSDEGTSLFQIISGIGHKDSRRRYQVSMDEIYLLFWHSLYQYNPAENRVQHYQPQLGMELYLKYTSRRAWVENQMLSYTL